MIPKIIWQTYKTKYDELPYDAKICSETWKKLNPEYEYRYMSDDEIYNFVKDKYGEKMLNLMKSFKVNVMKADLWRYLIIYEYGGLYTDIDTICQVPINKWLNADNNKMVVAPENDLHYAQWTFAAEPKSPIVKNIIDLVVSRCKNIDYDKPSFVHYYTANDVFTEGIRSFFNLPNINHECETMTNSHNCWCGYLRNEAMNYKNNKKMIENRFYCYNGDMWNIFRDGAVKHVFGSQNWKNGQYEQWVLNPLAAKSRGYYDIK